MTALVWDEVGQRLYQAGVDRGVLYLQDGTSAVWNGLLSVDDGNDSERKSFYLDGIKFSEQVTPGDFVGSLKAYTYPEEFDRVMGIAEFENGLSFHEQPTQSFNLSYRTGIGNDLVSLEYGYKIHLMYNLTAIPDSHSFESLGNNVSPGEFSWSLAGKPPALSGFRPTVHISIDTTKVPDFLVHAVENILYGTVASDPRFPTMLELKTIFDEYGELVIVDNGDGTWSANDLTDDVTYITTIDPDSFRIEHADAVYSDADTYAISTTDVPLP